MKDNTSNIMEVDNKNLGISKNSEDSLETDQSVVLNKDTLPSHCISASQPQAQAILNDFESQRQNDSAIHSLPLTEDTVKGIALIPLPNQQYDQGNLDYVGSLDTLFHDSTL